jgi:hypothetical protein
MAAEERVTAALLADLWDLVEGWSSGAIQCARQADATGPSEVEDAEIRLLVAHAAELRGVIEAHLAAAEGEPDPEPEPEPALPPGPSPTAYDEVPAHACNSADFDRPRCPRCDAQHWYCSVCGAQRDVCLQDPLAG